MRRLNLSGVCRYPRPLHSLPTHLRFLPPALLLPMKLLLLPRISLPSLTQGTFLFYINVNQLSITTGPFVSGSPLPRKKPDLHLSFSDPHEELASLIESGQVHMGCAIRASSLSLPLALCRPDGSCGLQFACDTLLESAGWSPSADTPHGTLPLQKDSLCSTRPWKGERIIRLSPLRLLLRSKVPSPGSANLSRIRFFAVFGFTTQMFITLVEPIVAT